LLNVGSTQTALPSQVMLGSENRIQQILIPQLRTHRWGAGIVMPLMGVCSQLMLGNSRDNCCCVGGVVDSSVGMQASQVWMCLFSCTDMQSMTGLKLQIGIQTSCGRCLPPIPACSLHLTQCPQNPWQEGLHELCCPALFVQAALLHDSFCQSFQRVTATGMCHIRSLHGSCRAYRLILLRHSLSV